MKNVTRLLILSFLAFGVACGDDDGVENDAATAADTATAMDTATTTSGCPGSVELTFDTPARGDTSVSGWDEDISGWLDNSDVACDPFGTDYPAPYQVFAIDLPESSSWDITVTPDAGVDVSLVGWLQGATDDTCRPLRGIGVLTCEVSNQGTDAATESIWLNATTNPYRTHILVATPPGGAAGGFEIRVVDHT